MSEQATIPRARGDERMTCKENRKERVITCSRRIDEILDVQATIRMNVATGSIVMQSKLTDVDEDCSVVEISEFIKEIADPPFSVRVKPETNEVTVLARVNIEGKSARAKAGAALDVFESSLDKAQDHCPKIEGGY